MTIAPYKYLISENLDNCGDINLDGEGILGFEYILNFLFDEVRYAYEVEKGIKLDHINIEFIDSPLPYASIQDCFGDYTINFSEGMKKLLYAFSFLCVIGYQYSCYLKINPENFKSWEILLKIFHSINELLNNFFVKKNYNFDLIKSLRDIEICFAHSLPEWSYQAHEVFEGSIRFILAHEIGHILEEQNIIQSKIQQEDNADEIAIQILINISSFKIKESTSTEYIKSLLNSDLYATYKAINFTFMLLILIDLKQNEMNVYSSSCGMEPDKHPSAEHRSNSFIFSENFRKLPTFWNFLRWRSLLIYIFSFGKMNIDNLNIEELKEIFKKI